MDYAQLKKLEFRRKFWKIVGAEIYVTDPVTQSEVGYIKMKAWKLREDIRLYGDRSQQHEIMQIHARQIIDFGATYDVIDSTSSQPVFALRRRGFKSAFVRDHWDLLDTNGNVMGNVQETSSTLALARRWLEMLPFGDLIALIFAFVPQTYIISLTQADGSMAMAGTIVHRKNPMIVQMTLDTSGAHIPAHPFITMASTAMLAIVDATKNS